MKKKILKTGMGLLLGSAIVFGSVSCKKYDEGGRLGAADKKIVNTWKVEYAIDLEDGSNITADFNGDVWEFTKDNDYKENSKLKGTYTFSEDKLTLIILKTGGGSDSYRVLKLQSDEMWLEDIGDEEIHLIPNN